MVKRSLVIGLLLVLVAGPSPAFAGNGEQRVALRRAVAAASVKLTSELAASGKMQAHLIRRILVVAGPRGPLTDEVRAGISDALTGMDGVSVVWPYARIGELVDTVFLDPDEPRYDPTTRIDMPKTEADEDGPFLAPDSVLIVHTRMEQAVKGGTRVAIRMELWDARTAVKVWGGTHAESFDLSLLEGLNAQIDAGQIEQALARIPALLEANPAWAVELELARARARELKAHAQELALVRGDLDQSRVDAAYARLSRLYAKGDPDLRDALWGQRLDIQAKLLAPVDALIAGDLLAEARAHVRSLALDHAGDLDLAAALARRQARIERVLGARDAAAEAGPIRLYALAGLLAVLLLGVVLTGALRKRARVARRNLGLDALETEAVQADRVKDVLGRDRDIRARMLRDLDRAEDALAEAHHQAQGAERAGIAHGVQAASRHLQELRRRVKLVQDGDPQDFLKGRLPKKNLEGLLASMPALAGQMQEFSKEAMAAQDSVTAGGDPRKNLRLLSGIALHVQGKLAEREAFFRKMA